MENKNAILETSRRIALLEEALNDIIKISNDAFKVFSSSCSLSKMEKIFQTSWTELDCWYEKYKDVPHFLFQDFSEIERAFRDVTNAHISRKDFSTTLAKYRKAVEECILEIHNELSKEKKKLDELYNEFAQNTGNFRFIFEENQVKQLIMDKLLKS